MQGPGQEGTAAGIKAAQNITGTNLLSISDIGEVRCLCRAQRILKPTPSDIDVSAAVPTDYRVASFLKLLNS